MDKSNLSWRTAFAALFFCAVTAIALPAQTLTTIAILEGTDGFSPVGSLVQGTVEGFFSLLKRGVYGSFHHISKQHLHRYLSEFDFRYNARDVDDGERRQLAIKSVVGKRLTYYPSKVGETSPLVN